MDKPVIESPLVEDLLDDKVQASGISYSPALKGNNSIASDEPAAVQDVTSNPVDPEASRTKLQTTIIMVCLCASVFLAALDMTIIATALPTISEHFHSNVGYTWVGSAYLLANAALTPSWGKISDMYECLTQDIWFGKSEYALKTNP
jgi:predicted secreted protein